MPSFSATLEVIVGNPFVQVPLPIREAIFQEAGKDKGPIPIRGTINGKAYQQTLVKYRGHWRLYVNGVMLRNSPQKIGEKLEVTVAFDPSDRTIVPHPKWVKALAKHTAARMVFEGLSPSRQKEIVRYIVNLRTEESRDKNIKRAINFLLGKESFVGRKKP